METVRIMSELGEDLVHIQAIQKKYMAEADVVLQRLYGILQSQPGTIPMLDRQVRSFHTAMNRTQREHLYETYENYAYAVVGRFFKVKFKLQANSYAQVPEIMLDSIEYLKDDTLLVCKFEALLMKINASPPRRNYRYAHTPFSFYVNFLSLTDIPLLETEEQVRMEIQDFLFDYTNLQELIDNE
jgi:hypothetical protein